MTFWSFHIPFLDFIPTLGGFRPVFVKNCDSMFFRTLKVY